MRRHDCFPNVESFSGGQGPSIEKVAYRSFDHCRTYVDLRGYEDDKTCLKNPHKGWFWHYVDNGFYRPQYREEHDPDDNMLDLPGLNHLYLRYDWGDIEKIEGKPDWSEIDRIIETWGRYGYKFSMRICTYEGSSQNIFATPEYVYRVGAHGRKLSNGCLEPDYGDKIFLEKLSGFMEQAGRKFNGDPRIECIDIGTFGTWGEGHTGFGTELVYPVEVIKKHIDIHIQNFPDTQLLLNDDHINSGWTRGEGDTLSLIRYARVLGLGLQDDSVCVKPYSIANGYNTLRTPWLFDLFWENAPIILEFEHYHMVDQEIFKQGFPFVESMKRTHTTFAGFHGYPRPWMEREPWLTEYCANRLGYWYYLNGYELPIVKSGATNYMRLYVENKGYGLCYHPYTLRVCLAGNDGSSYTETTNAGNCAWRPYEESCLTIKLRPKGLTPGNYQLYVGLFEGDMPIKLAFDQKRKKNGMYLIGTVPVVE